MLKRKISAVLSLVVTLLILGHSIVLGACMLSNGRIPAPPDAISFIMAGFMVVHAILSISILISNRKEGENKVNNYAKNNVQTIVQRVTGIAMLPLAVPHVLGTLGLIKPSQIVHAILPPVFFAVVMAHVAISFSKAFVTLGIGNAKFFKTADITMKILCAATLIVDIVGFYLFVC
ncbi:MAG: hypothetical protein IKT81_06735 [Clostridia bacterium]|nr:hypothetical protein [Clostridia bacterium]